MLIKRLFAFFLLATAASAVLSAGDRCDGVPRSSSGVTITCTKAPLGNLGIWIMVHVTASSPQTEAMLIRVNYLNESGQVIGSAPHVATYFPLAGLLPDDTTLAFDVIAKLPATGTDALVQVRELQASNKAEN